MALGVDARQKETAAHTATEVVAQIGECPLRVLASVVAVAILVELAGGDKAVELAVDKSIAHRRAFVTKASSLDPGLQSGCIAATEADKVDRAAQRGGAVGRGVGAPVDLGVTRRQGFDRLHVDTAVRQVERNTVLQQEQATAMKRALQPGAAYRDARLFGTEARLREHAGAGLQHVGQGRCTAIAVAFGVDYISAARHLVQPGARSTDVWQAAVDHRRGDRHRVGEMLRRGER